MSGDRIEERGTGFLGTRDGMRLAYGILWATWGDKNTAASIARHVLLAELTEEDRARGIKWASQILRMETQPDPLGKALNSGDGTYRP